MVEESLRDPRVLQDLHVLASRRGRPWTFHLVSVPEHDFDRQVGMLQEHMVTDECWYAHFFRDRELVVVYRDAVFRLTTDRATWAPAVEHGLRNGIPREQLDFEPRTWEEVREFFRLADAQPRPDPPGALREGDLRLRPLRLPEDVPVALPWYRDPEVLRFSEGGSAPYDPAAVGRMYRYLLDKQGEVYIVEVLTADGWRPVGDAVLFPDPEDSLHLVVGDPAFRGRGIGRRVVRLLVRRARERGLRTLRVRVYADNVRMRRVLEGLGFRPAGTGAERDRPPVFYALTPG